jgi:hypothetical protein
VTLLTHPQRESCGNLYFLPTYCACGTGAIFAFFATRFYLVAIIPRLFCYVNQVKIMFYAQMQSKHYFHLIYQQNNPAVRQSEKEDALPAHLIQRNEATRYIQQNGLPK